MKRPKKPNRRRKSFFKQNRERARKFLPRRKFRAAGFPKIRRENKYVFDPIDKTFKPEIVKE
jgi:hypothetical protein